MLIDYSPDSKNSSQGGLIIVKTEFPFYEPGSTVNGQILIQVAKPVATPYIEIEIKGQEKAEYT